MPVFVESYRALTEPDRKAFIKSLSGEIKDPDLILLLGGLTADQKKTALNQLSPPLPIAEEIVRMAYNEYGDQIRHFSTVRSALTTFLLTVALAAFSAFFNSSNGYNPFLVVAGWLFALAGAFVCLAFSFRTEKAVLRQIKIWKYLTKSQKQDDPFPIPSTAADALKTSPETAAAKSLLESQIRLRMRADRLNWVLVIGVVAVLGAFTLRNFLGGWLQVLRAATIGRFLP